MVVQLAVARLEDPQLRQQMRSDIEAACDTMPPEGQVGALEGPWERPAQSLHGALGVLGVSVLNCVEALGKCGRDPLPPCSLRSLLLFCRPANCANLRDCPLIASKIPPPTPLFKLIPACPPPSTGALPRACGRPVQGAG